MAVKLLDLKEQYNEIKDEIDSAIAEIVSSQMFVNGPVVKQFEENFAKFCNTKYALGCSSGTDALLMSLNVMDIGPGDEVITTPFTFFATVEVIIRRGATPVFVDIDKETLNIDTKKIEQAITDKTKAIIPVHLYGQCVNMVEINKIANKHDLYVIEDAAQAIGSRWEDRKAGSMGDTGCFSFFPSKNLGGFGDGGMVTTNNRELYEKMLKVRQHGINIVKKYEYELIGGNFRLDALQAGILDIKLKYVDKWSKKRRLNASTYDYTLSEVVKTPYSHKKSHHVYNQYIIRTRKRDKLMKGMMSDKIGCAIYYPEPIHMFSHLEHYGYGKGDFPNAERACKEVLAIPVYPELSMGELQEVIRSVKSNV